MRKRITLLAAGLAGLALAVVPAVAADQEVRTTSGNRFDPDEVTVDAGDTVTVRNSSQGFHNVHWADRSEAELEPSPTQWSSQRTFTAADAGKEFRFWCDPHQGSGMTGVVRVGGSGTGTGTATGTGTQTTPTGTQTTTQPPGADTTAPVLTTLSGAATRRLLRLRFASDEDATVRVRVIQRGRTMARRTVAAQAGRTRAVRIRRRLRRGRLTVRLSATDAAGNRAPARTLRLRVR
jgi:plastocyanin